MPFATAVAALWEPFSWNSCRDCFSALRGDTRMKSLSSISRPIAHTRTQSYNSSLCVLPTQSHRRATKLIQEKQSPPNRVIQNDCTLRSHKLHRVTTSKCQAKQSRHDMIAHHQTKGRKGNIKIKLFTHQYSPFMPPFYQSTLHGTYKGGGGTAVLNRTSQILCFPA